MLSSGSEGRYRRTLLALVSYVWALASDTGKKRTNKTGKKTLHFEGVLGCLKNRGNKNFGLTFGKVKLKVQIHTTKFFN